MNTLKLLRILLLTITATFIGMTQAHNKEDIIHQNNSMFSGTDTKPYQVVKEFHHALKSKNKELARSLLQDEVLIFEGGKVERSANEYASHHMQADMNYLSNLNVERIEQHVEVFGEIAISVARTKTTGVYKGKTIERSGMETIVLKNQNGSWKISHIHWSN